MTLVTALCPFQSTRSLQYDHGHEDLTPPHPSPLPGAGRRSGVLWVLLKVGTTLLITWWQLCQRTTHHQDCLNEYTTTQLIFAKCRAQLLTRLPVPALYAGGLESHRVSTTTILFLNAPSLRSTEPCCTAQRKSN